MLAEGAVRSGGDAERHAVAGQLREDPAGRRDRVAVVAGAVVGSRHELEGGEVVGSPGEGSTQRDARLVVASEVEKRGGALHLDVVAHRRLPFLR